MSDEMLFFEELHSSDWKQRLKGVEKLGLQSEQYPEEAFPALFACLTDKEPFVVQLASIYLKNDPYTQKIIDQIKMLINGNDGMRYSGIMSAEEIDEPYLIPLLKEVNDPDPVFQSRVDALILKLESYISDDQLKNEFVRLFEVQMESEYIFTTEEFVYDFNDILFKFYGLSILNLYPDGKLWYTDASEESYQEHFAIRALTKRKMASVANYINDIRVMKMKGEYNDALW